MKSWKTTLAGWIAGAMVVLAAIANNPVPFSHWTIQQQAAVIMLALSLAGGGTAAKDSTVHSTVAETKIATLEAPPPK